MIEVFDEKLVDECLSEVADSDIKIYAYCLLNWAVRKRKVQAVPLDRIKQAREKIMGLSQFGLLIEKSEVLDIIDELIKSEEK